MDGTRGSSSPLSPGTKRMACSFGRTRWTGGAIARAAAESGASSGTAAKCELCLAPVHVGIPWLATATFVASSPWGDASDDVTLVATGTQQYLWGSSHATSE